MKNLTILGSTGSIGTSTLKLVEQHPDKFKILALSADKNISKLAEQVQKFKPQYVALADQTKVARLKRIITDCQVLTIDELASIKADLTIAAITGIAGLKPLINAIKAGNNIGLANKESLVCAGPQVMALAEQYNVDILPIDSEHNGVHQLISGRNIKDTIKDISKITLTASGGPFIDYEARQLINITPAQAVKHPNWSMGAKISVDSATMMNKGLELIEAQYLFGLRPKQLDAIIHQESAIHALIEYNDGSILAQASTPDMCVPISNVLAYPQRINNGCKRLDLCALQRLTFKEVDYKKYPCFAIAKHVMHDGGAKPIILNAANEYAVETFLTDKIKFIEIAKIVDMALSHLEYTNPQSFDDVLAIDKEVRAKLEV